MFRTVFPSIIRSSRLYIQQQAYVKLLASGKEMELILTFADLHFSIILAINPYPTNVENRVSS